MRRHLRIVLLALLALSCVVVTGCGDDDTKKAGSTLPADLVDKTGQAKVVIRVADNLFEPRHVKITVGTTVVWRNEGRNVHNVFAVNGTTFPKTEVPVGGQVTYRIDDKGSIPYYCSIHGTPRRGQTGLLYVVNP